MSKLSDEIQKYSTFISNKGGSRNRKQSFDEEFESENFEIKNNCNSVIIGSSSNGRVAFNGETISDGGVRCLTIGTTGSGKSFLTRNIIESLYAKKIGIIIVIDPEGEYYSLRSIYDFVILGVDDEFCDMLITEENASELATKILKHKVNVIIDLKHTDDRTRQEIASKFIDSMIDADSKYVSPVELVIEEASRFAAKGINNPSNIKCTASLKKIAQFGRKRQISAFYNTQRITQLHKDISAECDSVIIGRCTDDADIKRNAAKIGLKNPLELRKIKHEFFAWGNGFDHADSNTYVKFASYPPNSEHKKNSRRDISMFPIPESEVVIKWIALLGGILKGNLNQIIKSMESEQLALIPEVISDKIESIPKQPSRQDELPDSLSEACEICGKTAIANGRCNNCADYESFGMNPNDVEWDDEDEKDDD